MKKQILIGLISCSSILTMNAQWTGTSIPTTTTSYVGIGITAPQMHLHIKGNTSAIDPGLRIQNDANNYMEFRMGGSGAGSTWYMGGANSANITTSPNSKLNFNVGGIKSSMVITTDGKVGIGNIDPLHQLDVSTSLGIINPSTATNAYSTFRMRGGTFRYGIELAFFGATTIPSSDNYFAGTGGAAIMNVNAKPLVLGTENKPVIFITGAGAVGIGTINPEYKLDVYGVIRARELVVDLNGVADYVFEKDYKLMNLSDVEKFVSTNKHLPGIPSGKEITENGLNMGVMQNKLLEKVEELTLYTIEQEKKSAKQAEEIEQLKLLVKSLLEDKK